MPEYTDDDYHDLRRRKNTLDEANQAIIIEMEDLRSELAFAQGVAQRAEAQLHAEQETMKMLIEDNNSRYQAQNQEVARLRTLLKENEIAIGD